ncbi:MAG: hypothetical protein U5N53_12100 [Mycobacterium sp.]|nr:hypothetical protein [Mycobacterium sp.]
MARGEGRKNRTGAFGSVDKLATGYRARYYGPDGHEGQSADAASSPTSDACARLALQRADIIRMAWTPPEADQASAPKLTLADRARCGLVYRDLACTREHYRKLLDTKILPKLGEPAGRFDHG